MKNLIVHSILPLYLLTSSAYGANIDKGDPLISYLKFDQLEMRDADEGTLISWSINAWLGKDLDKLWLKLKGEQSDGNIESQRLDILYNKAISAFWDLQMGMRIELEPEPTQNWIGAGFKGVAPYQIEMDINAFANKNGLIHFSLSAEYEYMFSQKVVLIPEIAFSLYSKDDSKQGIESGMADVEIGIRLGYEIKREFTPYIGINYESKDAKNFESQLLIGVRTWF